MRWVNALGMLGRMFFVVVSSFFATGFPLGVGAEAKCGGVSAFDTPSVREARFLHDRALVAGRGEVEDLEQRIFALLSNEPHDALLRAYAGSFLTIKSSKLVPGPRALKIFREGVQLINEAVENEPENISVRLIRAMNHSMLPAFFDLGKVACQDFKWLVSQLETTDGANVDEEILAAVYFHAGKQLRRCGEGEIAEQILRRGLDRVQHPHWRSKFRAELRDRTVLF